MSQRFWICTKNLRTGEAWEVAVEADEPARALSTMLRRKLLAEWLMSEDPFKFVVYDAPPLGRVSPAPRATGGER